MCGWSKGAGKGHSHVTALAECHRRYGAQAKTQVVIGTVVSVQVVPPSTGQRASTHITADYELGGGTIKRCQLNSRGVKVAEETTTTIEGDEPMTELGTENVLGVNETFEAPTPPHQMLDPLGAHFGGSDEETEDMDGEFIDLTSRDDAMVESNVG